VTSEPGKRTAQYTCPSTKWSAAQATVCLDCAVGTSLTPNIAKFYADAITYNTSINAETICTGGDCVDNSEFSSVEMRRGCGHYRKGNLYHHLCNAHRACRECGCACADAPYCECTDDHTFINDWGGSCDTYAETKYGKGGHHGYCVDDGVCKRCCASCSGQEECIRLESRS